MHNENDTGRKHAEEGPRQSGLNSETLLAVIPDLVFRIDRGGSFLDLRANDDSKLYVSRDAIVDGSLHATLPPDVADEALRRIARTLDTGEAQAYEYRLPMPQGVLDFEARMVASGPDEVLCLVRDVTERKQAERSLRRQNEYLAALHETSLALMHRLELADLLEAVVARAGALMGTPHGYVYLLEPGEAKLEMRVGLGIYEEYAGYRLGSGEGLAGKVHESGQSLVVEDYAAWEGYSAKFGRAAFHAVAGVPLRSGSEVVGVLGLGYVDEDRMFGDQDMMLLGRFAELASVALDNARLYASAQQELTERERAEKALGKSEEQYRMLVETVQEGLGFVDAEERITYCNRAYAELYGYDEPEELLGKGWNLLYDEEQLTWFHQYVMPALRRDGHWRGEAVGKKRDGGTFPQELSISPLKGGGFVCVVRDVTERKRTEEARRESEERFRHLIEQAADALFIHDIQGKFVDANQKACDLLGYTKEELLSLSVMDIEENFDPAGLVELWERVADKRSVMIEGRNIHKDGTRFPVEIHLGWFEANGERLVLATVRDVTERKQAEEKLKQSEERHRRQARELSLLHQVRTALAGELDPRAVFRTVVEAVAETYGYPLVSAYLLEDDVEGGTLVLQHHVGYQQTLPDRVPVSQSVMGRVARTGHPVLLEDVREDPDYLGAIEGVTSEVCAPLFDGGRVVGTLNVESTDGVRLTEDDLRVVGALAEHAGMAVGSARLHVRIREAEERFRAFFEHSATGISIATPDRRLIETTPPTSV